MTGDLPPYEGNDMAGYALAHGLTLLPMHGAIKSITNVRDTAVVVTDWHVLLIRSCASGIGFSVELIAHL